MVMGTHKKGFFEKILTSSFKKDGNGSWRVVLKGVPDKQVEANIVRLLTERLNASADDAAKIVRTVPIILFSDLTSNEAEQIKLRLNETGARTSISNDSDELRGLAMVSWPKKVSPDDFVGASESIPSPPPFLPSATPSSAPRPPLPSMTSLPPVKSLPPRPLPSIPPALTPRENRERRMGERPVVPLSSSLPQPVIPSRPMAPMPPASPLPPIPPPVPQEDWKAKFDQLQRLHAEALSKLEKQELELKEMQDHVRGFMHEAGSRQRESQEATRERDRFRLQVDVFQQEIATLKDRLALLEREREETLESLRAEIQQNASARDSLEKVITMLHSEKETMQAEVGALLKSIKTDLEFRIAELMRPVEPLKGHLKKTEVLLDNFYRQDDPDEPEGRGKHRSPKTPPSL